VAITSVLPLSGVDTDMTFQIEGRPPAQSPADQPNAWFRVVSPRYFGTMGMHIREGRGLRPDDHLAGPAVIVVNETLARRYWAGASPLGKKVTVEDQQATVVGVVADAHHRGPLTPPEAEMYLSYLQFRARGVFLVIRTSDTAAMVVPPLRDAVRQIDPNLPLSAIAPMTQLAARSVAQPRFLAALLTAFSAVAACLALVGIYSVLSFSVVRRTREIGIRMALGAGRWNVLGRILSGSMAVVGCGIAAGAVLAVLLSRLLASLLFGVKPGDPLTIAVVGLLIAVAALVASYAPARHASLVDPLIALRED
jgi:predicted permease